MDWLREQRLQCLSTSTAGTLLGILFTFSAGMLMSDESYAGKAGA